MKLFLFFSLLISQSFAQNHPTSYVPSAKILHERGYEFGIYNDAFITSKFVDREGKKQDLEGRTFQRAQSEVAGYYGVTNNLQLGFGARYRTNQATLVGQNEDIDASSSGLQSTFFHLKYAFQRVDQMQYALEGAFRYSTYSNKEFDPVTDDWKELTLGDAGNEVFAGFVATYQNKRNNSFTLRGGYRVPGSDLSHELYWQAEGALAWKYVALIAGIDGVSSVNNDPFSDSPESRPVMNRGTELYGSKNREWIAPYAGINFALGNTWRLELRGGQVVMGNSTDLGTTFGINLIRRVDKNEAQVLDQRFKTYDLEATVTKVSPKKEYVIIDKGLADNFYNGMRIDFFEFDYIGGNTLVASGVVIKTKSETSVVKITQRFNAKKEIKEGLIGRTSLK